MFEISDSKGDVFLLSKEQWHLKMFELALKSTLMQSFGVYSEIRNFSKSFVEFLFFQDGAFSVGPEVDITWILVMNNNTGSHQSF